MVEAMFDPGDERIDWRGAPISCAGCAHAGAARCRPGHACVEDRYARRIARFFDWNPALSDSHVHHPHFEVRAIAAKQADVFLLPALLDDEEEAVRWNAVSRLPARYKLKLRGDPHREVRIRIAGELDPANLAPMLGDKDYYVRLVVARRIDPRLLSVLMADPEAEVRRVVATRLPLSLLAPMVYDCEATVRLRAAERISAEAVSHLRGDEDWRVRQLVAARVGNQAVLRQLAGDPDPIVRETAESRLAEPIAEAAS